MKSSFLPCLPQLKHLKMVTHNVFTPVFFLPFGASSSSGMVVGAGAMLVVSDVLGSEVLAAGPLVIFSKGFSAFFFVVLASAGSSEDPDPRPERGSGELGS